MGKAGKVGSEVAAGDAVASQHPALKWAGQQLVFTEAFRGGPLVWLAGEDRLHGDPLGPVRHAHDDAAEYYYVFRGECLVEVSGKERIARAGDLVYIPPDAPHNLLGVPDHEAWTFILVSPNLMHNKWRTANYLPGTESLQMAVSRPFEGDDSAALNTFAARTIHVAAGQQGRVLTSESAEQICLVVDGRIKVKVGQLSGTLGPGDYFHVWRAVDSELSGSDSDAHVLQFLCPFKPYKGVDLGEGRRYE